MNYRHIYHAGNFAEVLKHTVLIALLQALQKKDKGFCYIDTHAGAGLYDLKSVEAQKTQESVLGIQQLLKQNHFPTLVEDYLKIIKSINAAPATTIRHYPGSPYFARQLLRPQDQMILCELHPPVFDSLKQLFRNDKQVAVHQQDGYQALKAFLPPPQRRGVVLIDPPFEQTKEFDTAVAAIKSALTRWETGIYALWYPIKEKYFRTYVRQQLTKLNAKEILIAELSIFPDDVPVALNGCGMAIINPPYQLDEALKPLLPWLWQALSPEGLGGCWCQLMVPS